MPTTVGSHTVATFTSPTNGTSPIDANQVRGNDNTLRTSYVNHDADPGIHFQSSTLASRPVAGVVGRKWMTVDGSAVRYWYDTGSVWVEGTAVGLSSAQTIALTGDVTGSVSTDLSTGASITTAITAGVIVNADINASAAIADTKLATISTAGKVLNSATTATSANTASAIVARDGSGNFTAGTITATLNGAAPAGSLSGSTLASGVTASSLTSIGTLSTLTVSGNVTVDTNTLFVDATNNRVGMGTSTPTMLLDVVAAGGNNAARFTATSSAAQVLATDGTVVQFVGYADTTVAYSGTSTNHAYAILTNNIERARVTSGGALAIGTALPDAAAILQVDSTTQGFLPPRMTTAQRDLISSPPNGLMLYNTTTDKLQVRAGGSWVDLH